MSEKERTRQQKTEQERAAQAWNCIERVPRKTDEKKYGTLARRLPSLIQANGLGQTLAFLRAKGGNDWNDAHNVLFTHISDWVKGQMKAKGEKDLLEWIIKESSDKYRRATTEAIAFALWLRRFAEAKGWGEAGGGA